MTIRRPPAFMARRSLIVSGRGSSGMGLNFPELSLPEVAVGQFRMRNDKVRLVHLPIAKPNDVEIQGAGAPVLSAAAPLLMLDRLQGGEQRPGVERGFQ